MEGNFIWADFSTFWIYHISEFYECTLSWLVRRGPAPNAQSPLAGPFSDAEEIPKDQYTIVFSFEELHNGEVYRLEHTARGPQPKTIWGIKVLYLGLLAPAFMMESERFIGTV